MYFIYRHIRPDSNEVFYIGKGKIGSKRHLSKQGRNNYWKNIVNLNSGKYDVEVILTGLTHEQVIDKEQEFIELYGRKCDGGTLCNLSLGGESGTYGYKHSEKSKSKMSKSAKGRKWSEEYTRNFSKSRKGVSINNGIPRQEVLEKAWKSTSKQVKCKLTGNIYKSLKEAALQNNLNYSTVKSRMERGSKVNTLKYV